MAARRIGTALREILNEIEWIYGVTAGKQLDDFANDRATRYIVERSIEIIAEASRRIPDDLKAVRPEIDWRAMAVRGSCLCGSVCFEVDLPFDHFVNCHCSRCRKATGTAHASNAVVQPNAFRWLSGAELVSRYDLPAARSFATAFCQTCGSPLPHLTRSGRQMIIPAGTFDEPLETSPDRHVHWRSRANWYEHGERLPTSD